MRDTLTGLPPHRQPDPGAQARQSLDWIRKRYGKPRPSAARRLACAAVAAGLIAGDFLTGGHYGTYACGILTGAAVAWECR